MIALDASFVIALRSRHEPHSRLASAVITTGVARTLLIHPLTLAEVLVDPARAEREIDVRDALVESGVTTWEPDPDEPLRIARLRATTDLQLPDCVVLALAEHAGATLASFDDRLRTVARARGLRVAPD